MIDNSFHGVSSRNFYKRNNSLCRNNGEVRQGLWRLLRTLKRLLRGSRLRQHQEISPQIELGRSQVEPDRRAVDRGRHIPDRPSCAGPAGWRQK
jgi:hypothetical protein